MQIDDVQKELHPNGCLLYVMMGIRTTANIYSLCKEGAEADSTGQVNSVRLPAPVVILISAKYE